MPTAVPDGEGSLGPESAGRPSTEGEGAGADLREPAPSPSNYFFRLCLIFATQVWNVRVSS